MTTNVEITFADGKVTKITVACPDAEAAGTVINIAIKSAALGKDLLDKLAAMQEKAGEMMKGLSFGSLFDGREDKEEAPKPPTPPIEIPDGVLTAIINLVETHQQVGDGGNFYLDLIHVGDNMDPSLEFPVKGEAADWDEQGDFIRFILAAVRGIEKMDAFQFTLERHDGALTANLRKIR